MVWTFVAWKLSVISTIWGILAYMYTKAAVLATSATSLPMWGPEGYRMVPLPNMVADFRDNFREPFVNFRDSTSPPADKKGSFHIHETVSVRVWEEILVRCWISPMPIRA